jgi:hypothetical protein
MTPARSEHDVHELSGSHGTEMHGLTDHYMADGGSEVAEQERIDSQAARESKSGITP